MSLEQADTNIVRLSSRYFFSGNKTKSINRNDVGGGKGLLDCLPREKVTDKELSLCLYCSDATHDLTYSVNHLQM